MRVISHPLMRTHTALYRDNLNALRVWHSTDTRILAHHLLILVVRYPIPSSNLIPIVSISADQLRTHYTFSVVPRTLNREDARNVCRYRYTPLFVVSSIGNWATTTCIKVNKKKYMKRARRATLYNLVYYTKFPTRCSTPGSVCGKRKRIRINLSTL